MTAPSIQPEPKRDRYGRYLLPDPGQPGATSTLAWTRATTFAKSISDTFGLTKWQLRMALKGLTMRPDLFARVSAATVDDRQVLDQVAEAAKEAAASSSGANLGSALHQFTERLDRGEQVTVPAPWDADVAAYRKVLTEAGIEVNAEWIERIIVVRQYHIAGTLDRILHSPTWRLPRIGDLKTGKDLSYGWLEIAVQEAIYANADAMWNGLTGQYEPMPEVDREVGVVIHLPVGKATATLYEVDLVAGWEIAQVCATVRGLRTRRDLARAMPAPKTSSALLLSLIQRATGEPEMDRLWADHSANWTTQHTTAAKARLAALSTTNQTVHTNP
ncbi:hypothetical protein ACFP2T_16350 [Plantactinospora solaniradicis]|uniref:PD-(D/E)XK endonuclease-like domain-containing protein n=1 Tax=Plantactinospora solaniradicis TaxID=1723736 RepID=A0ABW1K9T3_9ACTN